jgi:hypothetical protein
MPFGFAPEQTGGNIGHKIFVARNLERCDWTDILYIEPQWEDLDKLLSNQAGAAGHSLNAAYCGAIVTEESDSLLSEGATDMLYHKPQDDKACKL